MSSSESVADDFRALAVASLKLSEDLLRTMGADDVAALECAVQRGGRVVLEFGPLPEFERADLYLVEHEGRRWRLAGVLRNDGPMAALTQQ